jgi:hypothetical protein
VPTLLGIELDSPSKKTPENADTLLVILPRDQPWQ